MKKLNQIYENRFRQNIQRLFMEFGILVHCEFRMKLLRYTPKTVMLRIRALMGELDDDVGSVSDVGEMLMKTIELHYERYLGQFTDLFSVLEMAFFFL